MSSNLPTFDFCNWSHEASTFKKKTTEGSPASHSNRVINLDYGEFLGAGSQ